MRAAFAALLLVLCGFFGARGILVWRRTGRHPLPFLKARRPTLELVMVLGLWGDLLLVAAYAVRPFGPWLVQGDAYTFSHYEGLCFIAAACVVLTLAIVHMGQAWRIGIDRDGTSELVTTGIFARLRHPIYLGLRLASIGIFGMAPNVLFFAAAVLIFLGTERQARAEEEFLGARFGQSYAAYVARTGRFLPRW